MGSSRKNRVILTAMLIGLLGCSLSHARDQPSHLMVFVDCSGSMRLARHDEAVAWALSDMEVKLRAGYIVTIYPFSTQVLGDGAGRGFYAGREEDAARTLAGMRDYLVQFAPKSTRPRTAIWGSVRSKLDDIIRNGPTTQIAIYTDGEDNSSAQGDENAVKNRLSEAWRDQELVGKAIKLWVWQQDTVLRPSVSVRLTSGLQASLPGAVLRAGNAVRHAVGVTAYVAGTSIDPSDSIYAVRAKVVPLTTAAPALKVDARLERPLTPAQREGTVALQLQTAGELPGTSFSYDYEVHLEFDFQSNLPRLAESDRRQVLVPSQVVRLAVAAGMPHVDLEWVRPAELVMYPTQVVDLTVHVQGNADAKGLTCLLGATAPDAVEVGFLRADEASRRGGTLPSKTFSIILDPAEKTPVVCRVAARKPGQGTIYITGMAGAASERLVLPVRVVEPVIRVYLANPSARTELADRAPTGGDQWQPLAVGRVIFEPGSGVPSGTQVRVSVEPGDTDAEVAFSATGSSSAVVNVTQAPFVELYAKWRKLPPPANPSVPSLRFRVESSGPSNLPLRVSPDRIDLQGLIVLPKSNFWVEPVGVRAASGSDPANLSLEPVSLTIGDTHEQDFQLEWNTTAVEAGLTVEVEAAVPADRMETSLEAYGDAIRALGSGVYGLGRGRDDHMSARLRVRSQAKRVVGSAAVVLDIRLVAKGRTVVKGVRATLPYHITPAMLTVATEGNWASELPLYVGAALPIGTVRLSAKNAPGGIEASIVTQRPGVDIRASFDEEGKNRLAVTANGQANAVLLAKPNVPEAQLAELMGKTIDASLVIQPVERDILKLCVPEQPDVPLNEIRTPVRIRFELWSIRLYRRGVETQTLPSADAFRITDANQTILTSKWVEPLKIRVEGAAAIPKNLLDSRIEGRLITRDPNDKETDPYEDFKWVGFEIEGQPRPQPFVTVGQLGSVCKGLVFITQDGLKLPPLSEKYSDRTSVELFCVPLAMRQKAEIRYLIEPKYRTLIFVAVAIGMLGLLVSYRWYHRSRFRPVGVEEETVATVNDPYGIDASLVDVGRENDPADNPAVKEETAPAAQGETGPADHRETGTDTEPPAPPDESDDLPNLEI